ncbi:MAG TPA: FkbM family methyltransferase [Dehalococcoidia bacterium]|nr:FkbM family methyltransferase [Dehalococcoidia bacterium]
MNATSWPERAMQWARRVGRLAARRALGSTGELFAHRAYHRLLKATGRFAPPESAQVLGLLSGLAAEMGTLLDVGANVGRYSSFLRRHSSPGAMLYAFEPNPFALALLRANLGSRPDLRCLPFALGNRDGEALLSVPSDPSGNPVSGLGQIVESAAVETTLFEVELRRLDTLVDDGSVSLTAPVFIKVDIEGAEADFMAGAARCFIDYRPLVYFECEGGHLARRGVGYEPVWRFLSDLGYSIFAPSRELVRCDALLPGASNYLAVPWKIAETAVEYDAFLSRIRQLLNEGPRIDETERRLAHARG